MSVLRGPSAERKGVRIAGGETTAGVEIEVDLGAVLAGKSSPRTARRLLRTSRWDEVVDLRYGEAPPSPFPRVLADPRPETAKVYRGAAAGARELLLELR